MEYCSGLCPVRSVPSEEGQRRILQWPTRDGRRSRCVQVSILRRRIEGGHERMFRMGRGKHALLVVKESRLIPVSTRCFGHGVVRNRRGSAAKCVKQQTPAASVGHTLNRGRSFQMRSNAAACCRSNSCTRLTMNVNRSWG